MKSLWENLFRNEGPHDRITKILKETILFKDLSYKELKMVQKIMNERAFKAGEEVFHQGDTGIGMYIIASGSVNIFLEEVLEDQSTRSTLITRLVAGDFFGEAALVVENGSRSATAVAKEDSRLLSFFHPDLLEIVNKNPYVGNKILLRLGEVLGTRLRETNKKVIHLISEIENLKKLTGQKNDSLGTQTPYFT